MWLRRAKRVAARAGVASLLLVVGVSLVLSGAPTLGASEASPHVTPSQSVSKDSVLPEPRPIHTPSPSASPKEPWRFNGACLTIESIGLVDYPIRPTRDDELKSLPSKDAEGNQIYEADGSPRYHDVIEPAEITDLVWYDRLQDTGSTITADAENAGYYVAHSYLNDDRAPFNRLNELVPGDLIVIKTGDCGSPDATLTYEVRAVDDKVLKSDAGEVWKNGYAGWAYFGTCSRFYERDHNGATLYNTLVTAVLIQSVTVSVG